MLSRGADEGTEGSETPGRKTNLWDGSALDFPFWPLGKKHSRTKKERKQRLA